MTHGLFVAESELSLGAVHRLLIVAEHGLWSTQSSVLVVSGLSSCISGLASTACVIFVTKSGVKLMSPALADRFLTTGPPGKSQLFD